MAIDRSIARVFFEFFDFEALFELHSVPRLLLLRA